MSDKEYYQKWEQKHREERNARKRELYREKCRKKIAEELSKGIQPKPKKQQITLRQQLDQQKAMWQELKEWGRNQIID